jgi:hypothetical protein
MFISFRHYMPTQSCIVLLLIVLLGLCLMICLSNIAFDIVFDSKLCWTSYDAFNLCFQSNT